MKITRADHKVEPSNTHLHQNFFGDTTNESFFSPATIQPKLTIGQPNDRFEQEADAMADRVVRMGDTSSKPTQSSSPAIQTACADCEKDGAVQMQAKEEEEKPAVQTQAKEEEEKPAVQMQAKEEEEKPTVQAQTKEEEEKPAVQTKPLMRKAQNGGNVGTAALATQLNNSKGGGQSLPDTTNQYMSRSFGADFSQVRIHTDNQAKEMNQGLNARAFTHGSDIYFNQGEYNPGSSEGKRLLAHELTHVVQQGEGISNNIQCAGFSSSVSIRHNILRSRNFTVSSGTVSVTCDASWDRGFTHCPSPREYRITLKKSKDWWFDSSHGTRVFTIGRNQTNTWNDLDNGTYYLHIEVNDHNPHCILQGSITVIA